MKKNQCVKVAIRVRPRNQREKDLNSPVCVDTHDNVIQVKNQAQTKPFSYDYVFSSETKQHQIYEAAAFNLVQSVSEGYNGTIFAYGQTGAGKTFTMVGIPQSQDLKGIIPRTFAHFMNITQSGQSQQYMVRISYIEIYNQEIKDLLYDKKKQKDNKRDLKQSPDKGVFVKDLIIIPVKSIPQMDKLLDYGNTNRTVAQTKMNATSSRSHAIFTIYFETSNQNNGKTLVKAGKLNLVDLAGSERASKTEATGDTLKQGTKINLSLGALGNVINALGDGKKGAHIPYRDSKLTRLLQDSLGGNTKTIMIASVSPALDNFDQTVGTLRYASRAKNIKNAPKINEDPKDALIRQYAQQIKKLKAQLQLGGGYIPSSTGSSSVDEQQIRKQVQEKLKLQLDSQKNKIASQKNQIERQKEQLVKRIKQMEEALLKSADQPASVKQKALNQRKLKKKKIQRQEEIIANNIQQYANQNQNLLKDQFKAYNNPTEEISNLKQIIKKLRVKCQTNIKQVQDIQKEFQIQRQLYNDSVRQLQKQLSFFKGIASILLTDNQIQIIKGNSTYEEEKRQYKLSPFILKDKQFHFPKSLTSQQIFDLVQQNKQKRNLQLLKVQTLPIPSSPIKEMRRRIFKIPDYTDQKYKQKTYDVSQQSNLFKEQRFTRTNVAFRIKDRQQSHSRSNSNKQKLQPLKFNVTQGSAIRSSSKTIKLQSINQNSSQIRRSTSKTKRLAPITKNQ